MSTGKENIIFFFFFFFDNWKRKHNFTYIYISIINTTYIGQEPESCRSSLSKLQEREGNSIYRKAVAVRPVASI